MSRLHDWEVRLASTELKLSKGERWVLIVLNSYGEDIFPTINTLLDDLDYSKDDTYYKYRGFLEKKGLLTWSRTSRSTVVELNYHYIKELAQIRLGKLDTPKNGDTPKDRVSIPHKKGDEYPIKQGHNTKDNTKRNTKVETAPKVAVKSQEITNNQSSDEQSIPDNLSWPFEDTDSTSNTADTPKDGVSTVPTEYEIYKRAGGHG